MTNLISAPAVQRNPGTYNLPSTALPAATQSISIAISRANLGSLVGPVAQINIEGSADNVNWDGLGGCALDGGVVIKRDGSVATESNYTITNDFPAGYRVRATVIILQTCTASAVVRFS